MNIIKEKKKQQQQQQFIFYKLSAPERSEYVDTGFLAV